jgi:hypothetical protein
MTKSNPLNKAWAAWCHFIAELDPDAAGSTGYLPIHERLARFHADHEASQEHVEVILDVLYRGVPLLLAALGWDEPHAGSRGGKSPQTDRARGDQWRLVMAYGGFETLAKGLLGCPGKSQLTGEDFATLLSKCSLSRYRAIPSPELKEAVRERWFTPPADSRQPLLEFLGLSGSDTQAIYHWLAKGAEVDSWHGAVVLAKALCDVTAHGALSASKVREWRLRPALQKLTADLAIVAASALKALLAPPRPAAELPRRRRSLDLSVRTTAHR